MLAYAQPSYVRMYSGTISSEELVEVLISCSPVSVDAQSVAAIIHQVLDILLIIHQVLDSSQSVAAVIHQVLDILLIIHQVLDILLIIHQVLDSSQSVAAVIHQVLDILDQHTISLSETSSRSSTSLRMRIPLRLSHGYVVETGTAVLSDPLSGGTGGYGWRRGDISRRVRARLLLCHSYRDIEHLRLHQHTSPQLIQE
jgi:hypothetical protein